MKTPLVPTWVAILSMSALWPAAAPAQDSDGVLLCDGSGTAVSKPVGDEQWSIQYDPLLNAANGTVFDPVTGDVTFVSCFRVGAAAGEFLFDCSSPSPIDPLLWEIFAEDIPLAPLFFRLPEFYELPAVADFTGGRFRVGTDRPGDDAYLIDALLDDEIDGGVLRGTNLATGNPIAIVPTFTPSAPGAGPANYFFTEFGPELCDSILFNVQLFPPRDGDVATSGLFAGSGLTSDREPGGGGCVIPAEVDPAELWGAAGVGSGLHSTLSGGSAAPPNDVDGAAFAAAASRVGVLLPR